MRVLVLAPQPFYQERGTPIAVKLAVETLARTLGSGEQNAPLVDLLTYAEGDEVAIPGVRLLRTPTPRCLWGVRPGISCKKLLHDLFFFIAVVKLLFRERNHQYSLIHAVEESVFIAWIVKKVVGIPYIYDMDSSLALQLTERWKWAAPLRRILHACEGLAIRSSIAVAPVCDALEQIARDHGSRHTVLLRDISLLPDSPATSSRLHLSASIDAKAPILLYVGNLEPYQGIDLLIESFALVKDHPSNPYLVIIGGTPTSIAQYTAKAQALDCSAQVLFLGPRPVSDLHEYLSAADILVSPRTQGNNTPMKIYSYLHSGKALVATDLPTHRQVLNDSISVLAAASPQAFALGLSRLLDNPEFRSELGARAQETAQRLYTVDAFEAQVVSLYKAVKECMCSESALASSTSTAGE
jgi:glycosyltransferase involved in cell wall biosynthesis